MFSVMNNSFCTLSIISEQVYAISNQLSKKTILIACTADQDELTLSQYFPHIVYAPLDITHTYMLGLIMSNPDENVYYACKELFSMDFLIYISKKAILIDNLVVYINMCSCIIPYFHASNFDCVSYQVSAYNFVHPSLI